MRFKYTIAIMLFSASSFCMHKQLQQEEQKESSFSLFIQSFHPTTLLSALTRVPRTMPHSSIAKPESVFCTESAILFNKLPLVMQDYIWDFLRQWQHKKTLTGHNGSVYALAFSPDGSTIASGSSDNTIKCWKARKGQHQYTMEQYQNNNPHEHKLGIRAIAFSPDGNTLASGSDDNTIKFWNAQTGQHQHTIEQFQKYNPDGSTTIINPHGHNGSVYALAFSPDGNTLASGSDDKTIKYWKAQTGQRQLTIEQYPYGHTFGIRAIAFSPDGSTLASGSAGKNLIKCWKAQTGQRQYTIERYQNNNPDGHDGSVYALAFSPDGNTLASCSSDNTIKFWNAQTGQHQLTIEQYQKYNPDNSTTIINPHGHNGFVCALAFSPDGNTLASGSFDNTIKFWNAQTGQHQLTIEQYQKYNPDNSTTIINPHGHNGWINALAFSPDGNTLASGSSDNTIKLWKRLADEHEQAYFHAKHEKNYKKVLSAILKRPTYNKKSCKNMIHE